MGERSLDKHTFLTSPPLLGSGPHWQGWQRAGQLCTTCARLFLSAAWHLRTQVSDCDDTREKIQGGWGGSDWELLSGELFSALSGKPKRAPWVLAMVLNPQGVGHGGWEHDKQNQRYWEDTSLPAKKKQFSHVLFGESWDPDHPQISEFAFAPW